MTAVEDAVIRWAALVVLGLLGFWVLMYMTRAKPKRMKVVDGVRCWCKAFNPRADCYCVGFESEEDGAH